MRYAIEVFHAPGDRAPAGRYQTGVADGVYERPTWKRMDQPYPRVWQPRTRAEEAAWKCLMWTGRSGIPAMRVIDLEDDGRVVWCWGSAADFAVGAGPWILPDWHPRIWHLAGTGERPYPVGRRRRG